LSFVVRFDDDILDVLSFVFLDLVETSDLGGCGLFDSAG
jgi:hypothetical protein